MVADIVQALEVQTVQEPVGDLVEGDPGGVLVEAVFGTDQVERLRL